MSVETDIKSVKKNKITRLGQRMNTQKQRETQLRLTEQKLKKDLEELKRKQNNLRLKLIKSKKQAAKPAKEAPMVPADLREMILQNFMNRKRIRK
jgi:septal ring factor EnvC (AmiA/AmiB activator)